MIINNHAGFFFRFGNFPFLINTTIWFDKEDYKLDNPNNILQYIYSPTKFGY